MMRLPLALSWKATCAMPHTTSGYNPQHTTASTSVDITAPRISEKRSFIGLHQIEGGDDDVDGFNADERNDDAAEAVDQQVALQRAERANGRVLHAAQCQRNQRDEDQCIEAVSYTHLRAHETDSYL